MISFEKTDCVGIIAGSGNLVQQVAESCQRSQISYYIIAVFGQTDIDTIKDHPHIWIKLGIVSKTLEAMKQHNINKIVMVGRFKRPAWHQLRVDALGLKWIAQLSRALGDDSLLRIIIELLEKEGFTVIGPEDIIGQQLFLKSGPQTQIVPDFTLLSDIKRGQYILNHMSPLDIGQAVVIQQGVTLAVEGVEGTDELIKRCYDYIKPGSGPVLIKSCKQGQETRIDRATVGLQTIDQLIKYKFTGLAIQAHNTIVLDTKLMIQKANDAGLFIYGI